MRTAYFRIDKELWRRFTSNVKSKRGDVGTNFNRALSIYLGILEGTLVKLVRNGNVELVNLNTVESIDGSLIPLYRKFHPNSLKRIFEILVSDEDDVVVKTTKGVELDPDPKKLTEYVMNGGIVVISIDRAWKISESYVF